MNSLPPRLSCDPSDAKHDHRVAYRCNAVNEDLKYTTLIRRKATISSLPVGSVQCPGDSRPGAYAIGFPATSTSAFRKYIRVACHPAHWRHPAKILYLHAMTFAKPFSGGWSEAILESDALCLSIHEQTMPVALVRHATFECRAYHLAMLSVSAVTAENRFHFIMLPPSLFVVLDDCT